MAKTSKNAAYFSCSGGDVALAEHRSFLGFLVAGGRLNSASSAFVHEIQLFSCTRKYSRGMGYVNGSHMLIYRQVMPNGMPKEDKHHSNRLVRPLHSQEQGII
jgi:hypothetical protein